MPDEINQQQGEEAITFSPEQMALIREGLEDFREGKGYTQEEAREMARQKVRTWLNPNNQSA